MACPGSAQLLPNNPQPTDPLLQLMMSQPGVDFQSPVVARAAFEPPVIGVGGEAIYRVTFNALNDAITEWPRELVVPAQLELRPGARGQILLPTGTNYQPLTAINYRVRASAPGSFLVPQFLVEVYGKPVTIPGVRLMVVTNLPTAAPTPAKLFIEVADTNVFVGQAVTVRVQQPAGAGNVLQALAQMQLNGDGFITDQSAAQQRIQMVQRDGRNVATTIYQTQITPITGGPIKLSAQAFTAGNRFAGQIIITGQVNIPGGPPQYTLLESEPITINARPLPREGELDGFSGAIGTFVCDPPRLATNTVRVGDPVRLTVFVRGDQNLARVVPPPPPRVRDWQVYAGENYMTNISMVNPPPGPASQPPPNGWEGSLIQPGPAKVFTYTLVPLSDEIRGTPAIPFSCFDPERREYVDLTIPSVPIKVLPGSAPTNALALVREGDGSENEAKPRLSGLAKSAGRFSASLVPLQWRAGFVVVQLAPVGLLAGLWAWDRRRRFLEQHPEIVRRRQARRALRREWRAARQAAGAKDAARFAASAVSAMRVACAPHYPAEPRALVGADVLKLFGEAERTGAIGDVVRRFFAVTDATSFAMESADAGSLLQRHDELEQVLKRLEAKL